MKNIKEFLKELNEILNVNDIEGFVSAENLNDVEIDEESQARIKAALENLMTEDAAKNNSKLKEHFKKSLYPEVKGEILGNVDTQLNAFVKKFFPEKLEKFEEIDFTKDKVKWLMEEMPSLQKSDDSAKKQIEQFKTQVQQLNEELELANKQREEEVGKIKTGFEQRQLKNAVYRTLLNKEWAEPYAEPEVKEALMSSIYGKINSQVTLKLTDNEEIKVYQKDDPSMEYIVKGRTAKFEEIVNPMLDTYLKKSGDKDPVKKEPFKQREPMAPQPGDLFAQRRMNSN